MLLGKESEIEGNECDGEIDVQVAVHILGVNGAHMALEVVCSQETGHAIHENE